MHIKGLSMHEGPCDWLSNSAVGLHNELHDGQEGSTRRLTDGSILCIWQPVTLTFDWARACGMGIVSAFSML